MEKGDAMACFGRPKYIGEKSVRMLGGHEGWERITCAAKLRDRVEKSRSSRIGEMAVGQAILA